MAKISIVFLIFLILASSSAAVNDTLVSTNCEALDLQPEVCGAIHNMVKEGGLSSEEEKELVLLLMAQGDEKQMQQQAKAWNGNIVTGDESPNEGSLMRSQPCNFDSDYQCIKNAWISVFTVTPSVIEDGEFYISTTGSLITGYHYQLDKPPTQGRSVGSRKQLCDRDIEDYENKYGDCRTEFHVEEDLSSMKMKMNNELFFEDFLELHSWSITFPFPFMPLPSNSFSAEAKIHSVMRIERYDWDYDGRGRCCDWDCDENGCSCDEKYKIYRCIDKKPTEYDNIILTMSDTFEKDAKPYVPENKTHLVTFSNLNAMPHGVVETDAPDFEVQMERGKVGKKSSKYSFVYSHLPYNVLTLERNPGRESFYSHEAFVEKGNSTAVEFDTFNYNMDSCYFSQMHPFGRIVHECSIYEKASTELSVSTDKDDYEPGDVVRVTADFKADTASENVPITIVYGDEEVEVMAGSSGRATAEFAAKAGGHAISAYFSGDSQRSAAETAGTSIYVTDKNMSYYLSLAVLGFVVYGLVFFYKKYAEVLSG